MFFVGEMSNEDFYTQYGGQTTWGIRTPKNYPYIYIVISRGDQEYIRNDSGEPRVEADYLQYIRYGLNQKEKSDWINQRVLEHAGDEEVEENGSIKDRVYKSLIVFERHGGLLSCIGEYQLIDVEEYRQKTGATKLYRAIDGNPRIGIDPDGRRFFCLEKVDDLDDVELKLVVRNGESDRLVAERIGKRGDYRFRFTIDKDVLSRKIESISLEDIPNYGQIREHTFLDAYNNVVDIKGKSNEAKKAQQYLFMIQGIHEELDKNNLISDVRGHRGGKLRRRPTHGPSITYTEAYFYVVNVGWGLSQLLVFKNANEQEVWVFDCGAQNRNFENNLVQCYSDISSNVNTKVKKVFISHPHDDHFDRYRSFIDFNEETEVWINPNIKYCGNAYYNFLQWIRDKNCKVVEAYAPTTSDSNELKILHPVDHVVLEKQGTKVKRKVLGFGPAPKTVLYEVDENEINALSPIIELNIFDKKIIITGDTMGKGWEYYIRQCGGAKLQTDVYMHSHHGTDSGFLINQGAITNEYDLFDPTTYEFASLKDGHRNWRINATVEANATRTDTPNDIKYYKYDIKNNTCVPVM